MLDNATIDTILETYPDLVAKALYEWRVATAERERLEGKLYITLKAEGFLTESQELATRGLKSHSKALTVDDLRAMVKKDDERFKLVMEEAKAESEHTRLYETLMCTKRTAGIRTAH